MGLGLKTEMVFQVMAYSSGNEWTQLLRMPPVILTHHTYRLHHLIALKYLLLLLWIINQLYTLLVPLKSVEMHKLGWGSRIPIYVYANNALPDSIPLIPCAGRYAIYMYQVKHTMCMKKYTSHNKPMRSASIQLKHKKQDSDHGYTCRPCTLRLCTAKVE